MRGAEVRAGIGVAGCHGCPSSHGFRTGWGEAAGTIRGTGEVTDGVGITPSMRQDNLSRLAKALDDLEAGRADRKPPEVQDVREPVAKLLTRAGAPWPQAGSTPVQCADQRNVTGRLGA